MFSVPRLTSAVVAIAALTLASPLVAQSVSTLYLKDGGTLRGYIVDDSDPTSVRVKSEKSGTVFMLKRAWIDSIAGAWQGSLERPPQGEYEERVSL